jgi:hypothetical protein
MGQLFEIRPLPAQHVGNEGAGEHFVQAFKAVHFSIL